MGAFVLSGSLSWELSLYKFKEYDKNMNKQSYLSGSFQLGAEQIPNRRSFITHRVLHIKLKSNVFALSPRSSELNLHNMMQFNMESAQQLWSF